MSFKKTGSVIALVCLIVVLVIVGRNAFMGNFLSLAIGVDPGLYSETLKSVKKSFFLPLDLERVNRPLDQNSYPEIKGENVYQYLDDLTDFSLQSKADGNLLWGRTQGSIYERRATEYVKEKFDKWKLENVRIEEFPLHHGNWIPTATSVTVQMEGKTVALESAVTAFPSGTTGEAGVTLPIEYVGLGSHAELRGKDLQGKIALLYVRVFDGVLMHSGLAAANRIAMETEAEGIILWMDLPGNAKHATQLYSMTGGWVDSLPWVSIGFEDGFYLRQLIESNPIDSPPRVNLLVQGELHPTGTSQNLIAELPGTTDESLLITAHIDGFWAAALDNGTGVSALMELARYYAGIPQSERERNLIFLVTGDHELEGSGGSLEYEKMHPKLAEKTVLALQLEHLVGPGTSNSLNALQLTNTNSPLKAFVSNGNQVLANALADTADQYGLVSVSHAMKASAGDAEGFETFPNIGFIQTGYLYHSDADGMQWYSPDDLGRVTRAHAYLIDQVNELSVEEIGSAENGIPPYRSMELLKMFAPW